MPSVKNSAYLCEDTGSTNDTVDNRINRIQWSLQ